MPIVQFSHFRVQLHEKACNCLLIIMTDFLWTSSEKSPQVQFLFPTQELVRGPLGPTRITKQVRIVIQAIGTYKAFSFDSLCLIFPISC